MYQTQVFGDYLYHTTSAGYGDTITLFGDTKDGETPMSLVTIALSSCVTMCAQGYFARYYQIKEIPIQLKASFEDMLFKIDLTIDYPLTEQMIAELNDYIDRNCRVKKLLKEELVIALTIHPS
ncbi:OsmC family protein [Streptococcus dentiloxodontae]